MSERSHPESEACCEPETMMKGMKYCQVDALITIDGRGQIVLPKDVREKAKIKAGDKFVVISYESGGKACCFFLVRADYFGESVKGMLGPMMQEILQ